MYYCEMKGVIERYKMFIFIYTLINCFALMVNVFNIDTSTSYTKLTQTSYYPSLIEIHKSYILTHHVSNESNKFWPFINFTYSDFRVTNKDYRGIPVEATSHEGFSGIFYEYDVSEFVLYIGVLISFLIFKAYIITPKIKIPQI